MFGFFTPYLYLEMLFYVNNELSVEKRGFFGAFYQVSILLFQ